MIQTDHGPKGPQTLSKHYGQCKDVVESMTQNKQQNSLRKRGLIALVMGLFAD